MEGLLSTGLLCNLPYIKNDALKSLILVGGNTIFFNFSLVLKAKKTGVQSAGFMQPHFYGYN